MNERLIVGLGNPGRQYARSRHNAGFQVVDALVAKHSLRFSHKQAHSLVATGNLGGQLVVIAKPQTYMNLSGDAVLGLMARHRIRPANIVVIYDDMDLPLGKLRLRSNGSAGGHNGVQSIIDRLGTQQFSRLRVGIGRPQPAGLAPTEASNGDGNTIGHVLGAFQPGEAPAAVEAVLRAVSAIEKYLEDGLTAAMNEFNS